MVSEHVPHFYKGIDGWFDFEDLYLDWVNAAPAHLVTIIVEVGTWRGRSLAFLAVQAMHSGKQFSIHGVDLFERVGEYDLQIPEPAPAREALLAEFASHGVDPLPHLTAAVSWEAAGLFGPVVDRCMIDAAHDLDSVRRDLESWWPTIRPGGTMAGHDYSAQHPPVVQAVREFCAARGLVHRVQGYCWVIDKPAA